MTTPSPVSALAVSIQDIGAVHAACLEYLPSADNADMHEQIHACFERLQDWVRSLGLDPSTLLHIGIPVLDEGQLLRYECCIQVPESVQAGPQDVLMKELPGGRYAVLAMQKEPSVIGASIGRFYQEYVPENRLQLDGARPTYEVYYETTMEYCVPLLNVSREDG